MPSIVQLVRYKWHGLRSSLRFSNGWEILWSRFRHPRRRLLVYEWQSRFQLACDMRRLDHCSPKELLADAAYDLYIRRSVRGGNCAYVNIGANIGAFDVAVAAQATVPRGLSVEMNPYTFQRLAFNQQLNEFTTVRLLNCGVAAEGGHHQARLTACSLADSLFAESTTEAVLETVEIPLKTLEQCLAEAGFGEGGFELLKLDCEGAEYGIVRQTSIATLQRFGAIVMELHPCPTGETEAALREKLGAAGFQPQQLHGDPPPAENLHFWERAA